MEKAHWRSKAIAAAGIILLVVVTNEGYRYIRAVISYIAALESSVAELKVEVAGLKGHLSAVGVVPGAQVHLAAPPAQPVAPLPLPLPMAAPPSAAAEPVSRPKAKARSEDETKNLVSVVLMDDSKSSTDPSPALKPQVGSASAIKLLSEAK